jgi:hypothetical protein
MGEALDAITRAGQRNRDEGRIVMIQAVFERLAWIIHERAVTTARSAPRGCGRERMEPDISTGRPIVPRIPCGHRAGVDGRDRTALDNVSADSAPWA